MTMPYDAACGRRDERHSEERHPRRSCSGIVFTILIGLLAAALGLIIGALFAIPVLIALPAILVFAAIILLLLILKIITDICARR